MKGSKHDQNELSGSGSRGEAAYNIAEFVLTAGQTGDIVHSFCGERAICVNVYI